MTVSPLGISGAVIGKILDEALPLVRREAQLVTIFTGGNDVRGIAGAVDNGLGGSDPNGYIDQRVATFKSEFAALVAGTRSRAPDAKIVVLNLTNLGRLPFLPAATLQQKQWAQRASVGVTHAINATGGIIVVDLMCRTVLDATGNHAAGGFHPNDSGYSLWASGFGLSAPATGFRSLRADSGTLSYVADDRKHFSVGIGGAARI